MSKMNKKFTYENWDINEWITYLLTQSRDVRSPLLRGVISMRGVDKDLDVNERGV